MNDLRNNMYQYVPISQREKLGTELIQKLEKKGCNPEKVLSVLTNNGGKSGLQLREIITQTPIRYQNYALAKNFKKGIAKIGQGQYGTIYIGCLDLGCKQEIAIKKSECKSGSIDKEFKIMSMVYKLSPNITIPYHLEKCGLNCVLYLEYASGGSLQEWLLKHASFLKPEQIRNIVFQIIYTIKLIQQKYPSFRHNDLKTENVLVNDRASAQGYLKYGNYYVPNIGVQGLIADFGISNIGDMDGQDVIPEFWKNQYGIIKNSNKLYDIHYFLNDLYRVASFLPQSNTTFIKFIKKIFKPEYLGYTTSKIVNMRLRADVSHKDLPTIDQILNNPYFNTYKTKQNFVNVFNIKYNRNNLMKLMPQQHVQFNQGVLPNIIVPKPPKPTPKPKPPTPKPKPITQKSNRNRVVDMKTLKNLKEFARNRKIKGFSVYKKAQIENLRRKILNSVIAAPAAPAAPAALRNRVAAMKTLKNLKSVARNRKIKGFSVYKFNRIENLRKKILNNI